MKTNAYDGDYDNDEFEEYNSQDQDRNETRITTKDKGKNFNKVHDIYKTQLTKKSSIKDHDPKVN